MNANAEPGGLIINAEDHALLFASVGAAGVGSLALSYKTCAACGCPPLCPSLAASATGGPCPHHHADTIIPAPSSPCIGSSMTRLVLGALCAALLAVSSLPSSAADAPREPYGENLEGFSYPYPVHLIPVSNEGEPLQMAYMDVAPAQPNGRAAVLLHGRNFPSSYWAPVIKTLTDAGFRVVVPDQIGFGKSSKPNGELHFDNLARNTIALLDQLVIAKADIVAHSTGGMVAVRIARAFPDRIAHLVLTAPIGLEDYRLYVPPVPTEKLIETEDRLTAEGYRKQLETNYALKLPPDQITPYIEARFNIKGSAGYPHWLRAFVASYQMIYREPVVHEIPLITQPVLFIMGADDHNAPGRPYAPEPLRAKMGKNAELAVTLAGQMTDARAEVIANTGHLVFLEAPDTYYALLLGFLGK
jgi:proline iminopeptidase